MLHLAQIQRNPTSGKMELQLLAHQRADLVWEVGDSESLPLAKDNSFLGEGALVLVECGINRQIVNIQEAKDWILSILQQYSTKNASHSRLVEAEQSKVEQWRQEITAQSLELNRRSLEIETRREQLQELEQTLKQDKEELAQQREELQQLAENLKREQERLNLNVADEA
jgi:DNA repair exonuclease SbcCD ATPase subunit